MIGSYRLRNRKLGSRLVLRERLLRIAQDDGQVLRYFKIRGRFQFGNVSDNFVINGGISRVIFSMAPGSELISGDRSYTTLDPFRRALTMGEVITEPTSTGGGTVSGPSNSALAKGATSLTINSGTLTDNTWYYLWQTDVEETNSVNNETRKIGGELVYVTAVAGGIATIKDGLARPYPYSANLRLTPLPSGAKVCEDLRFRNFKIVAAKYHPGETSGLQALLYTAYCSGLSFQRCQFIGGYNSQVYFTYSRDVSVENCQGYECNGPDPLLSFAFCALRSSRITIRDLYLRNTQYGVSFAAGCSDFLVERVATVNNTQAGFDLHGGSTDGGTARFIFCPESQIQIGNPGWTLSCKNVTVEDSICAYITAKGWARDCTFQRIQAKWIGFVGSKKDPVGDYGGPENIDVVDSNFDIDGANPSNGRGAIWVLGERIPNDTGTYYGKYLAIGFTNCTFKTNQSSYGVLNVEPDGDDAGSIVQTSRFSFYSCTFTHSNSAGKGMILHVHSPFTGEKVTIDLGGCTFHLNSAVLVGTGSGASASTMEILAEGEGGNVRKPNPATPSDPNSTRALQSSDFTGITLTEP